MAHFDVAVAGAGPAGLSAALEAAAGGARVLLLERQPKPGRRLAATGNGRGNVGNRHLAEHRYNPESLPLIKGVSGVLDKDALPAFLASLGIACSADEAGRLYPRSGQAATMVWILNDLLQARGVTVEAGNGLMHFRKEAGVFLLQTADAAHQSATLILAVGGQAQPKLGGGDHARRLLADWDVGFRREMPALAPLYTGTVLADGVRVPAAARLYDAGDRLLQTADGEFQLTKTGVSGIAAMQLARTVNRLAAQKYLVFDFVPDMTKTALVTWLERIRSVNGQREARYILDSVLPAKLAVALALAIAKQRQNHELDDSHLRQLCAAAKETKLDVTGTAGWDQAQVMSGGVCAGEVNPVTLESHRLPGLFMCGEMLDVDGDTGGYNLNWAFLSGRAAGRAAARYVSSSKRR